MTWAFHPTTIRLRLYTIMGILLLNACTASLKNGPTVFSQLAIQNNANSAFQYSLYSLDSYGNEAAFIGSLQYVNNKIEWPDAVLSDLNSRKVGTSQTIHYIVKAYNPSGVGLDGDSFYEMPVITKDIGFNGSATAIWWLMRHSAINANLPLALSENTWKNILFTLESNCSNCILKPASSALQLLQSNSVVTQTISGLWAYDSAGGHFVNSVVAAPPIGLANSNPSALNMLVTTQSGAQGQTMTLNAVFYDIVQSTIPQIPDTWTQVIGTSPASTVQTGGAQLVFLYDYDNSGVETFTASKTIRGQNVSIAFPYSVSVVHRPPVFAGVTALWQANHQTTVDLSQYVTDPQGPTTQIAYQLQNFPTGVSLAGSSLSWNPTQAQTGPFQMDIVVSDSYGQVTTANISGTVLADHLPTFLSAPTSWNVTEGQLSSLSIPTVDADGDPIQVFCSGCTAFISGLPTGASWPTNFDYSPPYVAPGNTYGAQTATINYMPAYLQTAGVVNQNFNATISVGYPTVDTKLRSVTGGSYLLTVTVRNQADNPVWTAQPTASVNTTMFVNMPNFSGGAAQDPQDSTKTPLQPTPITYSISSVGQSASAGTFANNCNWFQVNPVTAVVSEIPSVTPVTAAIHCSFRIRATDTLGLFSDSNLITINTTEVNVGSPNVAATAIPNQTATEGVPFTLDLPSYFSDQNISAGDPNEVLTYACTNCAALGVTADTSGTTPPNGYTLQAAKFNWTPPFGVVTLGQPQQTFALQIQATDNSGSTATATLNLTVLIATAPMKLTFQSGTMVLNAGLVTMSANSASGTLGMLVSNLPNDGSSYPYTFSVTCAPNCRAGFLVTPSGGTGTNGGVPYTLTLNPTIPDGWGGPTANSQAYTVTVTLTGTGANSGITTTGSFQAAVTTVSSPPTGIAINGDGGTGIYSLTVDGSQFRNYRLTFAGVNNSDLTNDDYSYAFDASQNPAFSSITSGAWNFNPGLSQCLAGNQTITRTFTINALSSHGGSVDRTVQITITNARAPSGGSCPY